VALFHRLAAVLLCLGLVAGNSAVCAGWSAAPEARMACCTANGACAMHGSGSHRAGPHRTVTQAQADRCCAASERDESAPSSAASMLPVLPAAVAHPAAFSVPDPASLIQTWRTLVPVPPAHVPKHLLLSVLLV
jgi:hypothetical protein